MENTWLIIPNRFIIHPELFCRIFGAADKMFDYDVLLEVLGSIPTTGKVTENTYYCLTLVFGHG